MGSLDPIPSEQRNWNVSNFLFLWISAACTPTSYVTGASFLCLGLSWHEILFIQVIASLFSVVFLSDMVSFAVDHNRTCSH